MFHVLHTRPAFVPFAAALLVLLCPFPAEAQIKQPGAHPDYGVEIEPHVGVHWEQEPAWTDEGFGVGLRATIPFLDNGPISKINNNMGIGFGLDWAHFDDPCWHHFFRFSDRRFGEDCSADQFWFPVVLQWNFFLTPVISVFGEPGFGIVHTRWSYDFFCNNNDGPICEFDDSDTNLRFVFWGGGRFMLGDTVGAVVRIGSPSLTVGVTFLL